MRSRKWLLALWLGATSAIIWLPIPVYASSWGLAAPAFYAFLALLPLCYAAGERLTARWNRMRRVTRFALAAVIGAAVGLALRPYGIGALTAAVVAAAFVLHGMSPVLPDDRRQRELLTPALIVYFIASIAANFMNSMAPYRTLLAAGGVVTLLLAIRRVNRVALVDANLDSGGSVPRSVLVRNRALAAAFTAVALFIAFFRQLEALWDLFIAGLRRLIERLTSGVGEPLPEEMPADEGPMPMPGLPAPEQSEPSWFLLLLEKIAIAIGVLVLLALAALLLRQLLRIPALARWIARWLAAWRDRTRSADAGGYVDEVERLTGESLAAGVIRRLKSIGRRESWAAMTPEERIRWLFRRRFQRAEKRGFRYRRQWTPRENISALQEIDRREADARLDQVYEEVRYGGRPAGKDEAEALKERLEL